MKLQGKQALITGGSSGIGYAMAEMMLTKGASVAITGRRPDVLREAAERLHRAGRVEYLAADVSTEEGRTATLAFALQALGGLDVLVNNAGGVRAGRLEDTTEAEIRTMIEVDLVAWSSTLRQASRLWRRRSTRPTPVSRLAWLNLANRFAGN